MLSYEEQEFVVDIDGKKTVVKIILDQGYMVISWDRLLTPMQVLQLINKVTTRIATMILNSQIVQQYVLSKQSVTLRKLRC